MVEKLVESVEKRIEVVVERDDAVDGFFGKKVTEGANRVYGILFDEGNVENDGFVIEGTVVEKEFVVIDDDDWFVELLVGWAGSLS